MRLKVGVPGAACALVVCLFAASGCSNATRPAGADRDSAALAVFGGKTYYAGYGYEINTDSVMLPDAIFGTSVYTSQGASSTLEIDFVENVTSMESLTSSTIDFQANGSYGSFTGSGGYTGSAVSDIKIKSDSITLYARQRIALGTYSIQGVSLTPVGTQALADIHSFVASYGNCYLKSAKYAADLIYVYSYEYAETDVAKRAEMKVKLKAGIEKVFGLDSSYTLTEEDKSQISSLSKTIRSATNVAGFLVPTVTDIEQWKSAQKAFGEWVNNPANANSLQYVQATFVAYSEIASPVWSQYPASKTLLDTSMLFRTWQGEWNAHTARITDIANFTYSDDLKQQCANALSSIASEVSKIRAYAADARAPRPGEFDAIYAQFLPWQNVGDAGAPQFVNGWTNIGTLNGYAEPPTRFKKTAGGEVQIQLAARAGVGTAVFTLPGGYRPAHRLHFVGNDGTALSIATVDSNGDVSVVPLTVCYWVWGVCAPRLPPGSDGNRRFTIQFPADLVDPAPFGWQQPVLVNGWTDIGWMNGYAEPPTRFRKTSSGEVEVQVAARAGRAATVFTLPAGFRPAYRMHVVGNDGGARCIAVVQPNGNVDIVYSESGADGNRRFHIRFPAEPIDSGNAPWRLVGAAGEPGFVNGWANVGYLNGDTEMPTRFRLGGEGTVQVQLDVKAGTSATVFTLPIGYRPGHRVHFVGNDGAAFCIGTVNPTGEVTIVYSGSGGDGNRRFNFQVPL